MTPITLNDSTATAQVFNVVRQPAGDVSAILRCSTMGVSGFPESYPKIEVSNRMTKAGIRPVVSVVVPFGHTENGVFVKDGQVAHTVQASLQTRAPDFARDDAQALAEGLLQNLQIQTLFADGIIS